MVCYDLNIHKWCTRISWRYIDPILCPKNHTVFRHHSRLWPESDIFIRKVVEPNGPRCLSGTAHIIVCHQKLICIGNAVSMSSYRNFKCIETTKKPFFDKDHVCLNIIYKGFGFQDDGGLWEREEKDRDHKKNSYTNAYQKEYKDRRSESPDVLTILLIAHKPGLSRSQNIPADTPCEELPKRKVLSKNLISKWKLLKLYISGSCVARDTHLSAVRSKVFVSSDESKLDTRKVLYQKLKIEEISWERSRPSDDQENSSCTIWKSISYPPIHRVKRITGSDGDDIMIHDRQGDFEIYLRVDLDRH